MEKRIGIIAIIIEDPESVSQVNTVLHETAGLVVGRMGLPNVADGIAVISIVAVGDTNAISSMSGKLGQIPGVLCNTMYSKHQIKA